MQHKQEQLDYRNEKKEQTRIERQKFVPLLTPVGKQSREPIKRKTAQEKLQETADLMGLGKLDNQPDKKFGEDDFM